MSFTSFLATLPDFEAFTSGELDTLAMAMSVLDYPAGHRFTRQDHTNDTLYLIVSGEVRITRRRPGTPSEESIETLHSGDMLGLVSLLDFGPSVDTATALGPVTAASLPASAFSLLYRSNSPIAHHFQVLINRQLAHYLAHCTQSLLEAYIADDRERLHATTRRRRRSMERP